MSQKTEAGSIENELPTVNISVRSNPALLGRVCPGKEQTQSQNRNNRRPQKNPNIAKTGTAKLEHRHTTPHEYIYAYFVSAKSVKTP